MVQSASSVDWIAITGPMYVGLLLILAMRTTHSLELFSACIIDGAPSAFLLLGLGGVTGIEIVRLAGSNVYPPCRVVFYVVASGTTLGRYLALTLGAPAAADARRAWLPVAAMLLFPLIPAIGSSFNEGGPVERRERSQLRSSSSGFRDIRWRSTADSARGLSNRTRGVAPEREAQTAEERTAQRTEAARSRDDGD